MRELGPYPFEEITEYSNKEWKDYETTLGTYKEGVKADMTQYYVLSSTIDEETNSSLKNSIKTINQGGFQMWYNIQNLTGKEDDLYLSPQSFMKML